MVKCDILDGFLEHVAKSSVREKLKGNFSSQSLDRGQFVFFEGDKADALYLVESGVIEANVVHGDGKVFIFHFIFPGDIFGEGILHGQESYPFSTAVRKDAVIWKIAKGDLLPLLEDDPVLEKHLIGMLGQKLDNSYLKARCVAGEKVEKRVACILLKSLEEQGIFENCGVRYDTPLTNRDISGLIGSTEETVSRIMSRLKKEGVIGIEDKQLVVLDRESLVKYMDSL